MENNSEIVGASQAHESLFKGRLDPFAIKLEYFAGPMDLLLHLVRMQEVPIEKVEVREICNQYLTIVTSQRNIDLDKASEFLVIAATLLRIKSSSLLPNDGSLEEGENEEQYGEEFYEELRRRLMEYETTKQRALQISARPQLGVDTFIRKDKSALQPDPEELGEGDDAFSIGKVFASLLKRVGEGVNKYRLRLEPISVVNFMMKVLDSVGLGEKTVNVSTVPRTFKDIMRNLFASSKPVAEEGGIEHKRSVIIGSFIAVLELVKRGLITATQHSCEDEIKIAAKGERVENPYNLSSEFDEESAANSNVVNMDSYKESQSEESIEEFEEEKEVINRG